MTKEDFEERWRAFKPIDPEELREVNKRHMDDITRKYSDNNFMPFLESLKLPDTKETTI